MALNSRKQLTVFGFLILLLSLPPLPQAWAASCMTQAQMPATDRNAQLSAAKALATEVQTGNIAAIRGSTLPAVAADFNGIQQTVQYLQPIIRQATITVNNLFLLDASTDPPGQSQTDFYCGSPVVGFDFNGLPPGTYGLAIIHATGVKLPQQIVLILSKTQDNRWLLAGFFVKPMLLDGHDGTWYWATARKYAQSNGEWSASIYYRIAGNLLNPVDFLASPNLEKLRHEADQIHSTLPAASSPLSVNASGATYKVTSIDTTTEFGALDLDVHYVPDASQMANLRSPMNARKQVTDLMNALISMHPELSGAFHGMWLHADQGNASLFALELPMSSNNGAGRPERPSNPPVPR